MIFNFHYLLVYSLELLFFGRDSFDQCCYNFIFSHFNRDLYFQNDHLSDYYDQSTNAKITPTSSNFSDSTS